MLTKLEMTSSRQPYNVLWGYIAKAVERRVSDQGKLQISHEVSYEVVEKIWNPINWHDDTIQRTTQLQLHENVKSIVH